MGACNSKSVVKSAHRLQKSHESTTMRQLNRNPYKVNARELELLENIFKDLALRNFSLRMLEKSSFLSFILLPVT